MTAEQKPPKATASSAAAAPGPVTKLPFHADTRGAVSFVCGGLAGASVDAILFPLDTIKTRLQVRRAGATAAAASADNLYRNFYRGLGINCAGSFLSSGMFWTVYERTKKHVNSALPRDSTGAVAERWAPVASVSAAAAADVTACAIRVPFEVIKQQLQAGLHANTAVAARNIVAASGLTGLYAGFRATVIRELPFDAIEFALYEAMKRRYCAVRRQQQVDGAASVLLGGVAGGIAAGVTTPLDTVKTRLMTQLPARATTAATAAAAPAAAPAAVAAATTSAAASAPRRYTGVWDVLTRIAAEEGPKALFRGVVPRMTWISVGGGIFFGTYEQAVKLFAPPGYMHGRSH